MTVLVATLSAVAVLLLRASPARVAHPQEPADDHGERSLSTRLRPVLAPVAALGAWAVLGGPLGLVAAAAAGVTVWIVLGRIEDPAEGRRRLRLAKDLPVAVDLFGACLAAGAAPENALLSSGEALGGPVAQEFANLHHRLQLGISPQQVWRDVARHPELGPLGRAMGRAHDTGASVEVAVSRLAIELRDRAWSEVEAQARSIEVRAAAPMGLCLLPAFMLLGVVPMVAAVFGSMHLF